MINKTFVTPTQYAKIREIPSQRVYNWIQRRRCPYVESGGRLLVCVEEVDKWRKEHHNDEIN